MSHQFSPARSNSYLLSRLDDPLSMSSSSSPPTRLHSLIPRPATQAEAISRPLVVESIAAALPSDGGEQLASASCS